MEQTRIQAFGDELYQAMLNREAVAPLTDRGEDITINDAYHISLRMLERRLAGRLWAREQAETEARIARKLERGDA